MSEKLIIKNFGPIKKVELDIRRFNILIGQQATGKSTVAKLLAMCRYFSYIVENTNIQQPFVDGLISWGLYESIQEDTFIYYECNHYSFEIKRIIAKEHDRDQEGEDYEYDFPVFLSTLEAKSDEFKNLLDELEKIRPTPVGLVSLDFGWRIPTSFFQNDVASVIDYPFYLPAERGLQSIFSLGKNSIQNISDSLFNQFAELNKITLSFSDHTKIEPLDLEYRLENGKGRIRKIGSNEYFSINNAASGFQSTVPVVLLTKYYTEIRKKRKTFIIEEPELNLFPETQQKLMKFLVDKTMNFGNSILATTHSPYILTSLNNMMYAFQTGKNYSNEVESVMPKQFWLNPNDVAAYMMLPNGECESIIDKEGLIKTEKIDSVSSILNKDFNAIMDIEVKSKK